MTLRARDGEPGGGGGGSGGGEGGERESSHLVRSRSPGAGETIRADSGARWAGAGRVCILPFFVPRSLDPFPRRRRRRRPRRKPKVGRASFGGAFVFFMVRGYPDLTRTR